MRQIVWILLTAFHVAAVNAQSLNAEPVAKPPLVLKVPVAFQTSLPTLGSPIKWVAENLEQASAGDVRMELFEPHELVAPYEILDAVSSGELKAGYASAGYWAGKIPAAPLFSAVPFGPEAGEYLAWLYQGNGLALYQEMYDQAGFAVKVIPCAINAPETSGWFAKPIKSKSDLKGLHMRIFGLGGKVMERLGVTIKPLPGSELVSGLASGKIDAAEFSQPVIDQRLGLYRVVKYNYYPGWHQQATLYELLIHRKTWHEMSDSQQAVINMTCMASMTRSLAEGEALQAAVMRENVEKRAVKNLYWSEKMLALFKNTWGIIVAEESSKDPFFKKVWEDMQHFREGYDLWESYAFLPRAKRTE